MALSKVESASALIGAGKGFRDATGMDLGPGWLEVMLTTAPYIASAARSAKNTFTPGAETLREVMFHPNATSGTSGEMKTEMQTFVAGGLYNAAKTGFFMGFGYTVGYVASQFMNK